jgi:hypothetical protein
VGGEDHGAIAMCVPLLSLPREDEKEKREGDARGYGLGFGLGCGREEERVGHQGERGVGPPGR